MGSWQRVGTGVQYAQRVYRRGLVGHTVRLLDGRWAAVLDGEHLENYDDEQDARSRVDVAATGRGWVARGSA